jgi:type VI secretion system protein ImpK
MSDKDQPFGAFGRGERTIIRPNPGARRPPAAPPQPPAAPPAYPVPPAAAPPPYPAPPGYPPQPPGHPPAGPSPYGYAPPPATPYQPPPTPAPPSPYPQGYAPVPGSPYAAPPPGGYPGAPPPPAYPPAGGGQQYALPGQTPTPEEWIQSQQQQAPPPPPPPQSRAAELRIEELAAPHENPMMRSAGPLLLLLGRLRVALMRASFATLMEQVADAIKFFEKDIRNAGIPEDQANTAKYILCATADDIVQNIPTEDRHVWTQYSMLSRFFGERVGGVRFFEILDRTKTDPLNNYPLLELQHACLALGFQGLHRTTPNGQAQLGQIQREVYEILRRVKPKVVHDLSPRWKGQALAAAISRFRVPVWAVGSLAAALLVGLFLALRAMLAGGAEAAAAKTALLHPLDHLSIFRKVAAPPPPPPPPPPPSKVMTQLERVKAALAPEIAAGQINVLQTANAIIIRVGDLILFDSGKADVKEKFKPIAARMVEMLEKEHGWIKVVGHTDSIPIHNARFPTNFHLSVARANNVAALLKKGLSKPDRIETEGKGADAPIASNATAEGRQKNRRVEVSIQRTD